MANNNVGTVADEYFIIWRREQEHGGSSFAYETLAEHYPYTLPQNAVRFESLADMKRRIVESGSHYFDKDAIKFFRGRTHTASSGRDLWAGRFWVESRQYVSAMGDQVDPREYQVAWVSEYNGNLSIEKLGSYDNLPAARRAARDLAQAVEAAEQD